MSGGGGGGGGDDWRPASKVPTTGKEGSGGDAGSPNPCMFTEVTNLASPNMAVVSTLSIGSILAIVLQQAPLRVVAMSSGNTAGSITSARLADIIQCIRNGQQYQARVAQINHGAVTVEIYPV